MNTVGKVELILLGPLLKGLIASQSKEIFRVSWQELLLSVELSKRYKLKNSQRKAMKILFPIWIFLWNSGVR